MSRLFVNQLKENDSVSEIYRVVDKSLRLNKKGAYYLQFTLGDRTGAVAAMLWNVTEEVSQKFEEGDFVRCEGSVQLFQGKVQIIARKITKVDSSSVSVADFADSAKQDVSLLTARLREILWSVESEPLKTVVQAFLDDSTFMARFTRSFAGVRLHHAYSGGLLEHTVSMLELALVVGKQYSEIVDRDLLLVGVFLHDIGKTIELSDDPVAPVYSDEGQALGHLYLGAEILSHKLASIEATTGVAFDPNLVLKLKHMILSHHGSVEFGAVKVPMTREAIAIHFIDSIDAKLNEFQKFIMSDPNADKAWTNYNSSLDRKLLK